MTCQERWPMHRRRWNITYSYLWPRYNLSDETGIFGLLFLLPLDLWAGEKSKRWETKTKKTDHKLKVMQYCLLLYTHTFQKVFNINRNNIYSKPLKIHHSMSCFNQKASPIHQHISSFKLRHFDANDFITSKKAGHFSNYSAFNTDFICTVPHTQINVCLNKYPPTLELYYSDNPFITFPASSPKHCYCLACLTTPVGFFFSFPWLITLYFPRVWRRASTSTVTLSIS